VRRISWILFVLLDAALVAAFLAGYSAWYVPPYVLWWLELFAIVLPYVSLLVLPALLVAALARKWGLTALHLLLVVLIVPRFVPLRTWGYFREPSDKDLVVMTFNIPNSELLDGNGRQRLSALDALVEAERPHVIALQESGIRVGGRKIRSDPHIASLDSLPGYDIAAPQDVRKRVVIHQPLVARIETGDQTQAIMSLDIPGIEPTYVVRTPFTWAGKQAVHYNIHLQSFEAPNYAAPDPARLSPRWWLERLAVSRQSFITRAREAEAIWRMLNEEELPFIVSGDFNSTPHSWSYRHIARGLSDAYKSAGTGWGATWHARFPFARIDFTLASPEWEAVAAHVPDVVLSDHKPVIARLRWRDLGEGERASGREGE
jgi:endonuclease/exonuclease/phosphatase family metal-dependent hydrolase